MPLSDNNKENNQTSNQHNSLNIPSKSHMTELTGLIEEFSEEQITKEEQEKENPRINNSGTRKLLLSQASARKNDNTPEKTRGRSNSSSPKFSTILPAPSTNRKGSKSTLTTPRDYTLFTGGFSLDAISKEGRFLLASELNKIASNPDRKSKYLTQKKDLRRSFENIPQVELQRSLDILNEEESIEESDAQKSTRSSEIDTDFHNEDKVEKKETYSKLRESQSSDYISQQSHLIDKMTPLDFSGLRSQSSSEIPPTPRQRKNKTPRSKIKKETNRRNSLPFHASSPLRNSLKKFANFFSNKADPDNENIEYGHLEENEEQQKNRKIFGNHFLPRCQIKIVYDDRNQEADFNTECSHNLKLTLEEDFKWTLRKYKGSEVNEEVNLAEFPKTQQILTQLKEHQYDFELLDSEKDQPSEENKIYFIIKRKEDQIKEEEIKNEIVYKIINRDGIHQKGIITEQDLNGKKIPSENTLEFIENMRDKIIKYTTLKGHTYSLTENERDQIGKELEEKIYIEKKPEAIHEEIENSLKKDIEKIVPAYHKVIGSLNTKNTSQYIREVIQIAEMIFESLYKAHKNKKAEEKLELEEKDILGSFLNSFRDLSIVFMKEIQRRAKMENANIFSTIEGNKIVLQNKIYDFIDSKRLKFCDIADRVARGKSKKEIADGLTQFELLTPIFRYLLPDDVLAYSESQTIANQPFGKEERYKIKQSIICSFFAQATNQGKLIRTISQTKKLLNEIQTRLKKSNRSIFLSPQEKITKIQKLIGNLDSQTNPIKNALDIIDWIDEALEDQDIIKHRRIGIGNIQKALGQKTKTVTQLESIKQSIFSFVLNTKDQIYDDRLKELGVAYFNNYNTTDESPPASPRQNP